MSAVKSQFCSLLQLVAGQSFHPSLQPGVLSQDSLALRDHVEHVSRVQSTAYARGTLAAHSRLTGLPFVRRPSGQPLA